MKTKDKVKKSSSRGVKELRSQTKRLEVERRRFVTLRLSTLDFSTRIRRNKARMSMKTNSREVKKLSSREAEPGSQAVGCRRFATLRLSTLDLNSTEQSENVIENKGSSWKSGLFLSISSLAKDRTLHTCGSQTRTTTARFLAPLP